MGAGPGRPKGMQNKTTTALKEAILEAGNLTGSDGEGKGGMVGYLKFLATQNPAAFSTLLGKVLPHTLHVSGADGEKLSLAVSFTQPKKPDA